MVQHSNSIRIFSENSVIPTSPSVYASTVVLLDKNIPRQFWSLLLLPSPLAERQLLYYYSVNSLISLRYSVNSLRRRRRARRDVPRSPAAEPSPRRATTGLGLVHLSTFRVPGRVLVLYRAELGAMPYPGRRDRDFRRRGVVSSKSTQEVDTE